MPAQLDLSGLTLGDMGPAAAAPMPPPLRYTPNELRHIAKQMRDAGLDEDTIKGGFTKRGLDYSAVAPQGLLGVFGRAAYQAAVPQTLEAGAGLATMAAGGADKTTLDDTLQGYAKRAEAAVNPPDAPVTVGQALKEGKLGRYAAQLVGSGIGSTVPSAVMGGIGGLLGGPVGAAMGGFSASYVQNAGSMFNDLRDQGVPEEQAIKDSGLAGVPIAALDVLGMKYVPGLGKLVGHEGTPIAGSMLRRTAVGAARGAVAEAPFEAAQQAIQEAVTSQVVPGYDIGQGASNIMESFLGGLAAGGAMGGVGGNFEARPSTTVPPPGAAPVPPGRRPIPPGSIGRVSGTVYAGAPAPVLALPAPPPDLDAMRAAILAETDPARRATLVAAFRAAVAGSSGTVPPPGGPGGPPGGAGGTTDFERAHDPFRRGGSTGPTVPPATPPSGPPGTGPSLAAMGTGPFTRDDPTAPTGPVVSPVPPSTRPAPWLGAMGMTPPVPKPEEPKPAPHADTDRIDPEASDGTKTEPREPTAEAEKLAEADGSLPPKAPGAPSEDLAAGAAVRAARLEAIAKRYDALGEPDNATRMRALIAREPGKYERLDSLEGQVAAAEEIDAAKKAPKTPHVYEPMTVAQFDEKYGWGKGRGKPLSTELLPHETKQTLDTMNELMADIGQQGFDVNHKHFRILQTEKVRQQLASRNGLAGAASKLGKARAALARGYDRGSQEAVDKALKSWKDELRLAREQLGEQPKAEPEAKPAPEPSSDEETPDSLRQQIREGDAHLAAGRNPRTGRPLAPGADPTKIAANWRVHRYLLENQLAALGEKPEPKEPDNAGVGLTQAEATAQVAKRLETTPAAAEQFLRDRVTELSHPDGGYDIEKLADAISAERKRQRSEPLTDDEQHDPVRIATDNAIKVWGGDASSLRDALAGYEDHDNIQSHPRFKVLFDRGLVRPNSGGLSPAGLSVLHELDRRLGEKPTPEAPKAPEAVEPEIPAPKTPPKRPDKKAAPPSGVEGAPNEPLGPSSGKEGGPTTAPKVDEPTEPAKTEKPAGYGANNKTFTAEMAEKARATIRAKLKSQLNSGFDPELMLAGLQLAGYHIEAGARSFATYAKAMLDDMGESVRPYLKQWYNAVRDHPGFDTAGMTAYGDIPPDTGTASQPDADVPPHVAKARRLADRLDRSFTAGAPITWPLLHRWADEAFGGTMGSGAYDAQDLANATEYGLNRYILKRFMLKPGVNIAELAQNVQSVSALLPTQTRRSDDKIAFQQFSTPPEYGAVAAWAANIGKGESVLEPSAGTGNLAVWAKLADASRIFVNEIDPKRAELLRDLGFPTVFTEDAEQLNNILPGDVKPNVVIMNPPFSAAGQRNVSRDVTIGAKHIEQALKRLAPGGRLVAIVGRGMAMDAPRFVDWWKKIGQRYSVRANIAVPGRVYHKQGTDFGTRLLVIDNVAPGGAIGVYQDAHDLLDLPRLLRTIRDDRLEASGPDVGRSDEQGSSGEAKPPSDGRPGSDDAAGDQSSGGGTGPGKSGTPGSGHPRKPPVDADGHGTGGAPGGGESDAVVGATPEPGTAEPDGSGGGDGGTSPFDAEHGDDGVSGGEKPSDTEAVAPSPGDEAVIDAASDEDADASAIFETYKPGVNALPGTGSHPTPLVQSAAMNTVAFPTLTYKPKVPAAAIKFLSDAQAETVAYAGQAHEQILPDGETRRGFFIGDGTGVGKGAQIAAIIADNWARGRKQAVWISKNNKLYEDAHRDWASIGGDPKDLFTLGKFKAHQALPKRNGVMYVTYGRLKHGATFRANGDYTPTGSAGAVKRLKADKLKIGMKVQIKGNDLRSDKEEPEMLRGTIVGMGGKLQGVQLWDVKLDDGRTTSLQNHQFFSAQKIGNPRLDQIKAWLPKDFDGVIAFDEAHAMGAAIAQAGARGGKLPSAVALAGVHLQNAFPKARIVYVSATGATEVSNLAYAGRLGLWGQGTPFINASEFVDKIAAGGLAAMELVARDLKQMGLYTARSLSMHGVKYERMQHALTGEQTAMYEKLALGWQRCLQDIFAAMGADVSNTPGSVKGKILGQFWGANQRFFNQVMTAMQMPSMIDAIEADLKAGRAPVVQIVNHYAARLERAMAKRANEEDSEEDETEDRDIDLSPKQDLIDMIMKVFPIHQFQDVVDPATGKTVKEQVFDSQGKPVINQEAVRMRDKLITDINEFQIPLGPIDMLLQEFGVDNVSEVTGRSQRILMKNGKQVVESRATEAANRADIKAFQDDKKKILIFSMAGGTGASYHADLRTKNQRLRRHYVAQPGWVADGAIQGFGRTHRTNQKAPPEYVLMSTDLPAHARFVSSIAKRIEQMGALTKGQRTAGASVFSERDNLEGPYGNPSVRALVLSIVAGHLEDEGLTTDSLTTELGLHNLLDKDGVIVDAKIPPVTQFLNRLLSTTPSRQRIWFAAFEERMAALMANAIANGTFDTGMQELKAKSVHLDASTVVRTDETTGAQTHLLQLSVVQDRARIDWDGAKRRFKHDDFRINVKSGRLWAMGSKHDVTDRKGVVTSMRTLYGPGGKAGDSVENRQVEHNREAWRPIVDMAEAKKLWNEQYEKTPATKTTVMHMLTGMLLPIWNRLPDTGRVYRVTLDDKTRIVGREVPSEALDKAREALGVDKPQIKMAPAEIGATVLDGQTVTLSNRWTLSKAKVAGEDRIELRGPTSYYADTLEKAGVFAETHNYNRRYFVPTGEGMEKAIKAVMLGNDIIDVRTPEEGKFRRFLENEARPASQGSEAKRAAITKELRDLLRRIAGSRVRLDAQDRLVDPSGRVVEGRYLRGVIQLALDGKDAVGTLRHEAIHFLREVGAIEAGAWRILEKRAAQWRTDFKIDERYPDLSQAERTEEAIAEAYAAWADGKLSKPMLTAGPFARIKRVLAAIRDALRKIFGTLPTAEHVFEAIEGGRFADRGGAPGGVRARDMTAWHGSPHDHDRFDTGYIGTGEGNQSYGWGLYFASKKAVAEHYKEALSGSRIVMPSGRTMDIRTQGDIEDLSDALRDEAELAFLDKRLSKAAYEHTYANTLSDLVTEAFNNTDRGDLVDGAQDYLREKAVSEPGRLRSSHVPAAAAREVGQAYREASIMLQRLRDRGLDQAPAGKLYEVELAPTDDELLDWDRPLSEQPAKVREAAGKLDPAVYQHTDEATGTSATLRDDLNPPVDRWRGHEFYDALSKKLGSPQAASAALRDAGVPGIRYLDAGSRKEGKGHHNYVIFDDKHIAITAKYRRGAATNRPSFVAEPEPGFIKSIVTGFDSARADPNVFKDKVLDHLIQQYVNIRNPLFRLDQRLKAAGIPGFDISIGKMADMAAQDSGRFSEALHTGPPKWNVAEQIIEPMTEVGGLVHVFDELKRDKGEDYNRYQGYVIANRAKRLLREGRERLLSDDAIRAALDVGEADMERYDRINLKYQRWNKKLLDFLVATSTISKSARDVYAESMDYVPFYRVFEKTGELMGPRELAHGLSNPDPGIKHLLGGTSKIGDLMDNIARNTRAMMSAGLRNVAMTYAHDGLEAMGELTEGPGEGSVSYFRIGQRKFFRPHDPAMLVALAAQPAQQLGGFVKFMQAAARVFRAGITLSPPFAIANWMRGAAAGFVQTGQNASWKYNSLTGFAEALKGSASVSAMKMASGTGGYSFGTETPQLSGSHLRMAIGADPKSMFSLAHKVLEGLETFGEATEMGDRVAIYNNMIANGATKFDASYSASNLINYSRHGASPTLRLLTSLVPFLNARIQGLYRMFEHHGDRSVLPGIAARGALLMAVSLGLYALNNWDDDNRKKYEAESITRKVNYFIIYGPGDTKILIPKPFEFGALFATLPEFLVGALTKKNGGPDLANAAIQTFFNTFSANLTPQALKPAIEAYLNYDMFRTQPLESEGQQRLMPANRVGPTTSTTAEEIGKVTGPTLGLSPIKVQHLIEGYLGTFGGMLLSAIDAVAGGGGLLPHKPDGVFGSVPIASPILDSVLGRFIKRSDVDPAARWVDDFYTLKQNADQVYASMRLLRANGEHQAAADLAKGHAAELRIRATADRVGNQLSDLNRAINKIKDSPNLSSSEMRARIDPLILRRNAAAKRVTDMALAASP